MPDERKPGQRRQMLRTPVPISKSHSDHVSIVFFSELIRGKRVVEVRSGDGVPRRGPTVFLTKRTDPSRNNTFTPPGWFELALINVVIARPSSRESV